MRSEKEIKEMKEWLLKALDDEDNQGEFQQAQIYAKLDLLRWLEG